jgi:hypothetical protein
LCKPALNIAYDDERLLFKQTYLRRDMWPPCLAQCYPISFCITDLYETKVQFLIALEGILSGIDANVIKAISSKEALLIMLEKVN